MQPASRSMKPRSRINNTTCPELIEGWLEPLVDKLRRSRAQCCSSSLRQGGSHRAFALPTGPAGGAGAPLKSMRRNEERRSRAFISTSSSTVFDPASLCQAMVIATMHNSADARQKEPQRCRKTRSAGNASPPAPHKAEKLPRTRTAQVAHRSTLRYPEVLVREQTRIPWR